MGDFKKLNGRPKMNGGKKTKFINVRFTEEEFKKVETLEKESGLSKTELIRRQVLTNAGNAVVNGKELIEYLDHAGNEMARIGNNINQLARHANVLKLKDALNPMVIQQFNRLLEDYIQIEQMHETALRKIIRALGS